MSQWAVSTKDGHLEINTPFFRTMALFKTWATFQSVGHFGKRRPLLKTRAFCEMQCYRSGLRTDYKNSFGYRATQLWNILPKSVRETDSLAIQYKYRPVLRQNVWHSPHPCLHCQKQRLSSRRRICVVASDGDFLMRSQPKNTSKIHKSVIVGAYPEKLHCIWRSSTDLNRKMAYVSHVLKSRLRSEKRRRFTKWHPVY